MSKKRQNQQKSVNPNISDTVIESIDEISLAKQLLSIAKQEHSEDQDEIIVLLKQIQLDTQQQKEIQQQRFLLHKITTGLAIFIFIITLLGLVWLVPILNNLVSSIEGIVIQITQLLSDLGLILQEINDVDLSDILNNINTLIDESKNKIGLFDVDKLNKAIKNLSDTIGPLAKILGIF